METIITVIKDNKKDNKPGRGGRRAGAGRPSLEPGQEPFRAVTKSITLTREEWDLLGRAAPGLSVSKALAAALALALDPRSHPDVRILTAGAADLVQLNGWCS